MNQYQIISKLRIAVLSGRRDFLDQTIQELSDQVQAELLNHGLRSVFLDHPIQYLKTYGSPANQVDMVAAVHWLETFVVGERDLAGMAIAFSSLSTTMGIQHAIAAVGYLSHRQPNIQPVFLFGSDNYTCNLILAERLRSTALSVAAAGFLIEDHMRYADESLALSVPVIKTLKNLRSQPWLDLRVEGNAPNVWGFGFSRRPFVHHLAERFPEADLISGKIPPYPFVSAVLSTGLGWGLDSSYEKNSKPDNNRLEALDLARSMLTYGGLDKIQIDRMLFSIRYNDNALLIVSQILAEVYETQGVVYTPEKP